MTKSTEATSVATAARWLFIAGSVTQLQNDFETMTTTQLRRKYSPKISTNKSFEATLRRVRLDLKNSNNQLNRERGADIEKAEQLHKRKKKKKKKNIPVLPKKYPVKWKIVKGNNVGYCSITHHVNYNTIRIYECDCSLKKPTINPDILNQFFYESIAYMDNDVLGKYSSRWVYSIQLSTGTVTHGTQRQQYIKLVDVQFDMELDWIKLIQSIGSGQFIGATIFVEAYD